MTRDPFALGGALIWSIVGLLVLSWIGLAIAAPFARSGCRRSLLRAALMAAVVAAFAVSVVMLST